MNNISYSSRYKFLISLGVLLVASPFLFILGYMKSIGELLELKDFPKGYEKDVIDLISFKKDFLFTIKHNPRLFTLIAILIIGFGLYLIKIGLDRWEEFDNVDLEKLKNENEKLENENKKLIIEIGGLENVNSTLAHLSTVSISEAIDNKNLKMLTSENVENYSKDIIYGEKFINQLRLECADDYLIYNNFKLDNEYILDAVAISKLKAEKDIIYEIKYLNNLDKLVLE